MQKIQVNHQVHKTQKYLVSDDTEKCSETIINYPSTNSAVYLVSVSSANNINISSWNINQTARMLQQVGLDFEEIEPAGKFAVKLYFEVVRRPMFSLSIKMMVERVVHAVTLYATEKYILGNAKCQYPILNVRRMKKRIVTSEGKNVLVDTKSVECTIEAQNIPDHIVVSRQTLPTFPKYRKLVQCTQCYSYSHSNQNCKQEQK